MIEFICLSYYIFSVLFMIGYIDSRGITVSHKLFVYFIGLIIAPIMFPINIGYCVRENS